MRRNRLIVMMVRMVTIIMNRKTMDMNHVLDDHNGRQYHPIITIVEKEQQQTKKSTRQLQTTNFITFT
jgi:hypothetical protein